MLPPLLNGVKYWALWFNDPKLATKFQVYKFRMHDTKSGMYYFESVRGPRAIIARNHYQINVPNFKPFLINGGKAECQSTNTDASSATENSNQSNELTNAITALNAPVV
jgi:hypothetical protein